MTKIAICGAGIGGLATALAFANVGINSIVIEKASELGEIGAGLQLAPNAFRALDVLGVGSFLDSTAVVIQALNLIDMRSGNTILRVDTDYGFVQTFGFPYAVVHRAHLHSALLKGCLESGRVRVMPGAELVELEEREDHILLRLRNGGEVAAALAVGADGLHSVVRAAVLDLQPPRPVGHTTYRALVPMAAVPAALRRDEVSLWAGQGKHAVAYPISSGSLLNVAATVADGGSSAIAGERVDGEVVTSIFQNVSEPLRSVLSLPSEWASWTLMDRPPTEGWSRGSVTLVGDAAHASLQYLAQGAAMALEDAIVLAEEVSASIGDVLTALTRYEARRYDRTSSIQQLSRTICERIYHADGAEAAERDERLRLLSTADIWRSIDWLYGSSDKANNEV